MVPKLWLPFYRFFIFLIFSYGTFSFVEDTRIAAKLLQHFDIQKKTKPFHEHNENEASDEIIQLINNNLCIIALQVPERK